MQMDNRAAKSPRAGCSILLALQTNTEMSNKPSIPSGTRDFGPDQMAKRGYALSLIESVFRKYGYQPLNTPSMENLSTLTGKYGDEGDQLIYKILNSGDFLKKLDNGDLSSGYQAVTPKLAEKGLRYDLTVPFARYVAMNRNEITLPFRRFQIQPVWRADRPQKGRYREFLQCDADVIGSDALICEAEMVVMIKEIFSGLGIEGYTIRVNHRNVLSAMAASANISDREGDFYIAIDKLEKIGEEGVKKLLEEMGMTSDNITSLFRQLTVSGEPANVIAEISGDVGDHDKGSSGLQDLTKLIELVQALDPEVDALAIDPSLARGLSYYTGIIFEVTLNDGSMGSLAGGGRYDDLTGAFGWPGVPGVGFSLGVDRIIDVLQTRELFPGDLGRPSSVMLATFDESTFMHGVGLLARLRSQGISAEIYPTASKIKKQMNYANSASIPQVVLIGEDEMKEGVYTLRDMNSGDQEKLTEAELIEALTNQG